MGACSERREMVRVEVEYWMACRVGLDTAWGTEGWLGRGSGEWRASTLFNGFFVQVGF